MYCPHCGQQQATSDMRFCSRCGFPLIGVAQLLASGGVPLTQNENEQGSKLTPRQKGIRQGAMLMLSTLLIVPLVTIIGTILLDLPTEIVPATAIILFIGGLLRIFYALLFQANPQSSRQNLVLPYVPPSMPAQVGPNARTNVLPPPQSTPVTNWRRPDTSELVQPPTVTENTTRLLDEKIDPQNR